MNKKLPRAYNCNEGVLIRKEILSPSIIYKEFDIRIFLKSQNQANSQSEPY